MIYLKKLNSIIVGIIIFVISCVVLYSSVEGFVKGEYKQEQITDTVIKIKAPAYVQDTIATKEITKPKKVIIYKKLNRELRDTMLNDDLITYIHLKRRLFLPTKLEVTKIDTAGKLQTAIYDVDQFRNIEIDRKGSVSVKRKRKILRRVGVSLAVGTVAFFTGKYLYKKLN